MMRRFRFLFLVVIMLMMTELPALSAEKKEMRVATLKRLLPLNVEGYRASGKDEVYDRQTAFRYMNGAAELYRAYAFTHLIVRQYVQKDHPSILVELFDMGSSEDAFGIFSYQTEDEEVGIGQGSDYGGGLLRFWRGQYFVNVYAEKETPFIRNAVLKMGRTLSDKIKKDGQKPKLIALLPSEGLIERSLRYFHLHQVLNHHYFLSHENLLHLSEKTDAVLATYHLTEEKTKTYLLLIQYPDSKQAEKGFDHFKKAYLPEASDGKAVRTENGKWTSAKHYQQYVWVVFDAPSEAKAEQMVEEVNKRWPPK